MPEIHLLDSETIDKIAAGEVVERPSSVVKELVENAVDAGATAIAVEIKDGGIEFIRVTDNGYGIPGEQIRSAFLRHATSKIDNARDLTRISSLGFRGEALSSIAAVSKVELITKTRDSLTGNRIILEGAEEKEFAEVGAPDGTTFIVRSLFYNTPVRRKFLKLPATEGGYIADLMEHLALSRPDISFKFQMGGRLRFHTTGNGDLKEVIYRIYGRDVAASLIPIKIEQNGNKVEGYLGKPVVVRSNRNYEIYFVNGRFIRSNLIAKALEEGYREYLMQHKFPLCVLHITMDTGQVDVNVHPTKMDVRFSDGITFCKMLSDGIHNTLVNHEMIPDAKLGNEREERKLEREQKLETQKKNTPEPFESRRSADYRVMEETNYRKVVATEDFLSENDIAPVKIAEPMRQTSESGTKTTLETSPVSESGTKTTLETTPVSESGAKTTLETAPVSESGAKTTLETAPVSESGAKMTLETTPVSVQRNVQTNLFEEKILSVDNSSRYHIIGQVFDTYWMVQFEDKLLIIDQHAAHEKVKYERFIKQFREKQVLSQNLVPPIIVSLTAKEELVLSEHMDKFASLGFEIEPFGGKEYAIRSVPMDLYGCGERELFIEVLDELEAYGGRGSFQVIEEKIASMACKAAVKGNNHMSNEEMRELINELLTLDNPYNCPHGRPTIVTMSKYEMDRKFKRIV